MQPGVGTAQVSINVIIVNTVFSRSTVFQGTGENER
jgi:hypothetical protein